MAINVSHMPDISEYGAAISSAARAIEQAQREKEFYNYLAQLGMHKGGIKAAGPNAGLMSSLTGGISGLRGLFGGGGGGGGAVPGGGLSGFGGFGGASPQYQAPDISQMFRTDDLDK